MGRRLPCCSGGDHSSGAGLTKGHWTQEEDEKLEGYIRKHGHKSWRALPKLAGLNRCSKSCRLRWTNYLRPDIKRGPFEEKEEQLIIQLHSSMGNKWSAIAKKIPGRTDNEIKNYWNTHLRKKLLHMGIDPVTHRPRPDLTILANLPSLLAAAAANMNCSNGLVPTHLYPFDHGTALRLHSDAAQLAKAQLIHSLAQVLSAAAGSNSSSCRSTAAAAAAAADSTTTNIADYPISLSSTTDHSLFRQSTSSLLKNPQFPTCLDENTIQSISSMPNNRYCSINGEYCSMSTSGLNNSPTTTQMITSLPAAIDLQHTSDDVTDHYDQIIVPDHRQKQLLINEHEWINGMQQQQQQQQLDDKKDVNNIINPISHTMSDGCRSTTSIFGDNHDQSTNSNYNSSSSSSNFYCSQILSSSGPNIQTTKNYYNYLASEDQIHDELQPQQQQYSEPPAVDDQYLIVYGSAEASASTTTANCSRSSTADTNIYTYDHHEREEDSWIIGGAPVNTVDDYSRSFYCSLINDEEFFLQ